MMLSPQILRGRPLYLYESIVRGNQKSQGKVPEKPKNVVPSQKGRSKHDAAKTTASLRHCADSTVTVPNISHQQDAQTDSFYEEISQYDQVQSGLVQTEEIEFEDEQGYDTIIKVETQEAATQIDLAEVFDFDEEVIPILEVVIGQVLRDSATEIAQKEETEAVMKQQQDYAAKLLYHQKQMGKLKDAEKRRAREIQRRRRQTEIRKEQTAIANQKQAAWECASNFLSPLRKNAFERLRNFGWFKTPAKLALQCHFVPALSDGSLQAERRFKVAQDILEDAIDATSYELPQRFF